MTGTDLSSAMIRRAKDEATMAQIEIPLFVQDLRKLEKRFEPNQFDAVLVLGHTLSHLLTEKDLFVSIEQVKHALKPQGLLFIDLPERQSDDDDVLEYSDGWIEQDDEISELFFSVREAEGNKIFLHCFHLTRKADNVNTRQTTIPMLLWDEDFLISHLAESGFSLVTQAESSFGKGTRFALKLEG
jgi:SAM-dependent methyltransferase